MLSLNSSAQGGILLNRSEQGCLVIADVSGYTGYLAGTELDHAQDVLADLIGTVVGAFQPRAAPGQT